MMRLPGPGAGPPACCRARRTLTVLVVLLLLPAAAGRGQLREKPGLAALVAKGRAVAPRPLILTSANHAYLGPFLNLAASVLRASGPRGLEPLVLITLDADITGMLATAGLGANTVGYAALARELGLCGNVSACTHGTNYTASLTPLWSFRVYLLRHLVANGVSVLLNDVDAVWVTDAVSRVVRRSTGHDVVASRGAYPGHLGRRRRPKKTGKWGATLCMGFVYFNSTMASASFLDWALRRNPRVVDDQAWLNTALDDAGLTWDTIAQDRGKLRYYYGKDTNVGRLKLNHTPIPVAAAGRENDQLRVSLVPLSHVDRHCSRKEKHAAVLHCHTTLKDGATKEWKLRRRNMWFLHETWEQSLGSILAAGAPLRRAPAAGQGAHSGMAAWVRVLRAVVNRSMAAGWPPLYG